MLVSTALRVRILSVYVVLAAIIGSPSTVLAVDLYSQNFESVSLGPDRDLSGDATGTRGLDGHPTRGHGRGQQLDARWRHWQSE